jgi:hypothetical protein
MASSRYFFIMPIFVNRNSGPDQQLLSTPNLPRISSEIFSAAFNGKGPAFCQHLLMYLVILCAPAFIGIACNRLPVQIHGLEKVAGEGIRATLVMGGCNDKICQI